MTADEHGQWFEFDGNEENFARLGCRTMKAHGDDYNKAGELKYLGKVAGESNRGRVGEGAILKMRNFDQTRASTTRR